MVRRFGSYFHLQLFVLHPIWSFYVHCHLLWKHIFLRVLFRFHSTFFYRYRVEYGLLHHWYCLSTLILIHYGLDSLCCLALKPNYYYVTLFPQGNIFQVQITALTQELVNHEICSQSGFRFLEKRVLMHLWNMPAPPQLVKLQAQEISRMKASCIARGQWRWQNPMSWAYHWFSIASFLGDCPCGRF